MNIDPTLCRAARHLCRSPQPAPDIGRGLCQPCEHAIPHLLTDLIRDHSDLDGMLGEPPARAGEQVAGSHELQMPLNGHVDELQGRIVHLACAWEDHVLGILERHLPLRIGLLPKWRLSRAVGTLTARSSVLLALGPRPYAWHPERAPVMMDGVDAVLAAAELHHLARSTVGVTKLVHKLHGRCMECSRTQTLRREDGSDVVYCCICRHEMTMQDYDDYLGCFTPTVLALGTPR